MEDALSSASPRKLQVPAFLLLALVPLSFAYVIYWSDATDLTLALFWHLTHGNHVTYADHTFRLPLLWRPVEVEKGIVFRHSVGDQINVNSSISGTLTETNALALQKHTAESLTHDALSTKFVAETVHARDGLNFHCVREQNNTPYAIYVCWVPGTDWEVGATGTNTNIDTVRNILANTE